MRHRHNPRDFFANRRVNLSTGFICGNPIPLPPIEKYVPVNNPDLARQERYREGARKAWQKRRANVSRS